MNQISNVTDCERVWKIENFSELVLETKHNFDVAILENSTWELLLDLNGHPDDTNAFISIFIRKSASSINIPLRFELTLSILSTDASSHLSKKVAIFCVENSAKYGFEWFIKREELFSKRSVYLPQDTLTIQCYIVRKEDILPRISIGEENESRPQNESDIRSVNNDLYNLYLNGKLSDIKIETSDRTLAVHKTVLCARSPVFFAMFENDSTEKMSGIVKMTDLDSETVNIMITFLYTDSIENINRDQATELYKTAKEYKILPLKQRCSSELKKGLSDINFYETYCLADMDQDIDLKAAVEEYVFIYLYRIFKSCEWKSFMQSNYKLSGEIMHKLWIKNFDV